MAAAQLTVTSSADSGAGTLRDAIDTANAGGDNAVIDFQLLVGDDVIRPASALPTVTVAITFMGTGAPDGYSNHITLSGENAGDSNGLTIKSSAVTVDGLTIVNFQRSGIDVSGAQMGVQITNCLIGTDGTQCLANNHHGILFDSGVSESNIIGNVISGNG